MQDTYGIDLNDDSEIQEQPVLKSSPTIVNEVNADADKEYEQ
jgi:hypothetical protein